MTCRCDYWKIKIFLVLVIFLTTIYSDASANNYLGSISIYIDQEMLRFDSIETYENYLTQMGDDVESIQSFIANLPIHGNTTFRSLADAINYRSTDAGNKLCLIQYLLNEKGMIIIGDWIIKVDKANERVGVMNIDHIGYMDDLENDDFYFHGIKWFTTEDDVLPALMENPNGAGTLSLNQLVSKSYLKDLDNHQTPGITNTRGLPTDAIFWNSLDYGDWHRRYNTYDQGVWLGYKYDMEHEYNRYGVYYRLHLDITRTCPDFISENHPMCGYSAGWYYKNKNNGGEYWGSGTDWAIQKRSSKTIYQGTRYLRKFQVGTTFYFQVWNPRTLTFMNYYHPMIGIAKF